MPERPGRSRSTKKLAQRIDLNYFKRLYPIPRWRRTLTFALLGICALWLGWDALAGKQRAFNAGPLAHSHAILTNHCTACHATQSSFGRKATDPACLACHDGPIHHAEQTFTPACADCHVEHKASFRLASVRSEACTQCHANLKTKISAFESSHPEFAALRNRDPGTIRLNHQVHMADNLRGPHGPVHLACSDCHTREQGQMLRVDYSKHCASCHPLMFDPRIPEPAPHEKPQVVVDFVISKLTQYIASHPEELRTLDVPDARIMRQPRPPAGNAAEWLARRVADAEQLLWRKTCEECHTLTFPPASALPAVAPAQISARWFRHAQFDHDAHQMLVCTECHARALTSTVSADVLLPGIDTCRQCHRSGAVNSNCSECHSYHDWTKEKKVDGKFTISNVR